MSINNHWRNKQLGNTNNLLWQETFCYDFMSKHQNVTWKWHGNKGIFFDRCSSQFSMSDVCANGLIIINYPTRHTPKNFVAVINSLLHPDIDFVYLAVNRYEFVSVNDLDIQYHDELVDCISQIVDFLHVPFVRASRTDVSADGNHFVGVHGLDIFTYENN